jgi:CRP-like cAMP-binding protein
VLEPDRREVATIGPGGYFGEMSLLTGEPRTATVLARGDTVVIEIEAERFREIAARYPHAAEQIGIAALRRREELDRIRTGAQTTVTREVPATFLSRMKRFLRLQPSSQDNQR